MKLRVGTFNVENLLTRHRFSSGERSFTSTLESILPVGVADVVSNFSFVTHFDAFTKGIVDPKDVVFFLSLIGFTLFLNVVALEPLAIGLLLVGLVLVNYLASSIPARVDTTAESIYSLSAGTKSMLGKVEEPVVIDLYFSKDASGLPIRYKNYATRVQEMLRQYVRAGRGKLTLNVINPRPDTPDEEKATAAGLTPQVSQQGGEQFFFGLVVTQADQQ
eukprot:gene62027-84830_t